MTLVKTSLVSAFFWSGCAVTQLSNADILPLTSEQVHNGTEIMTNQVTSPDWTRRDEYSKECIGPGESFQPVFRSPFAYATVRAEENIKTANADADEKRCWVTAHDYVDLAPGISEPKKLCLHTFVKSKGGAPAAAGSGYLACDLFYKQHDPETPIFVNLPTVGTIVETTPSLPTETNAEFREGAFILLKSPFSAIEERLNIGLKEAVQKIPGFGLISARVMSQNFSRNLSNPFIFTYNIVLEGDVALVGFDCNISVKFAIPSSKFSSYRIVDSGSVADCGTKSFVGQLTNFPNTLGKEIVSTVLDAVNSANGGDKDKLAEWREEDPRLVDDIFVSAFVQGRSCRYRQEEGICLILSWSDQKILNRWWTSHKSPAQIPNIPPDTHELNLSIAYYQNVVNKDDAGFYELPTTKKKYPTGYKDFLDKNKKVVEDGDMMLFGGLMCHAGITEGCNLVKDSISNEGRPWRSPRRVGEPETIEHSTFSGDQLKGLMLYWLKTNDVQSFVAFLRYIKTQKTYIPSDSVKIESGYSMCSQRFPNFTCLIAADWLNIFAIANKFGVVSELPKDFANIIVRYEITSDDRLFDALTAVAGYRLHLVALNEYISSLASPSSYNKEIFQIISSRQPENPFFAFLLHGKNKLVQDLADKKCPRMESRIDRSDWTWQRGDVKKDTWKNGMGWDCLFIYSILQ